MKAPRFTRQDAEAFGRKRRKHVGRSALGAFDARSRRVDPLAVIAEAAKGPHPPPLPHKFHLMAAPLFAFFRRSAQLIAPHPAAPPPPSLPTRKGRLHHLMNLP